MSTDSPQVELLQWHYRLVHFLFTRLGILSALGILLRKLFKLNLPKCSVCLYGAMTKRPWRNKSAKNKVSIRKSSAPGYFISVDQMESSPTGFIDQLQCKPPSTVNALQQSSWITTVIWPTCNCREDCHQKRRYKHRKDLRLSRGCTR